MRRRFTLAVSLSAFLLTIPGNASMAQSSQRIQLAQLEQMFATLRAKTNWNVDGPLLWGYFFLDPEAEKLQLAARELGAAGYHVVGIEPPHGRQLFRLHVERVEVHTPVSLNARNGEFYVFAASHSLAAYDGMDVGPPPGPAR